MAENYLNYKLDGEPIGLRKGQYLSQVGELVYIWDPKAHEFIDSRDPLKQNVEIHDELDKVPEGKLLVVLVINPAFDAVLAMADEFDFHEHWENVRARLEKEPGTAVDKRYQMYYLIDRDKCLKMFHPKAEDFKYMEDRKSA